MGRTTSITDPLGYTYDSLGRVSTITLPRPHQGFPENFIITYTYDNQGRLTIIINRKPDAGVFSSYAYCYDYYYSTSLNTMKGFRTSMTNHLSQVEKYYFDDLYQLTRVEYPNKNMHQWSYDDIGNRA